MIDQYNQQDLRELIRLRRWLHQHPELSMQEYETSRFISEYLDSVGITHRIVGKTAVIADLRVDEALPTIAIRSEIDALPVSEQTGLECASVYPGRMHACGHDAITAVALYLARRLAGRRSELKRNVRFLFEPAEETGSGAQYMIANGALDNPRPDGILVFHFGNQQARSMEIQRSISTAKIGRLRIQIKGKASHWSQRVDGIDAMYAAARLVVAIQDINASFATQRPFVLGFGLLHAGKSGNILAEAAELCGSLRTFTDPDFESVLRELNGRIRQIEQETGAVISLELSKVTPPIVNAPALVERGKAIGAELFGESFFLGDKPFLVGDNAAYYMEQIPGMRIVFLAGKEGETAYPVHNPKFDIDEGILLDALKFLESFILA